MKSLTSSNVNFTQALSLIFSRATASQQSATNLVCNACVYM